MWEKQPFFPPSRPDLRPTCFWAVLQIPKTPRGNLSLWTEEKKSQWSKQCRGNPFLLFLSLFWTSGQPHLCRTAWEDGGKDYLWEKPIFLIRRTRRGWRGPRSWRMWGQSQWTESWNNGSPNFMSEPIQVWTACVWNRPKEAYQRLWGLAKPQTNP